MAQPCELHCERADASRRSVNNYFLVSLQPQDIVNALECREPGCRYGAGVKKIQPLGNGRDFVCGHRDVFGIEAAFRIVPSVSLDAVADVEAVNSRTQRNDGARSVNAEHVWKL